MKLSSLFGRKTTHRVLDCSSCEQGFDHPRLYSSVNPVLQVIYNTVNEANAEHHKCLKKVFDAQVSKRSFKKILESLCSCTSLTSPAFTSAVGGIIEADRLIKKYSHLAEWSRNYAEEYLIKAQAYLDKQGDSTLVSH